MTTKAEVPMRIGTDDVFPLFLTPSGEENASHNVLQSSSVRKGAHVHPFVFTHQRPHGLSFQEEVL